MSEIRGKPDILCFPIAMIPFSDESLTNHSFYGVELEKAVYIRNLVDRNQNTFKG